MPKSFHVLVAELAEHESKLDAITKTPGCVAPKNLVAAERKRLLAELARPATDFVEFAEKAAALRILYPAGELHTEARRHAGTIEGVERSLLADALRLLPAKL